MSAGSAPSSRPMPLAEPASVAARAAFIARRVPWMRIAMGSGGRCVSYAPERKYTPTDASKEQLFALRDHLGFDPQRHRAGHLSWRRQPRMVECAAWRRDLPRAAWPP